MGESYIPAFQDYGYEFSGESFGEFGFGCLKRSASSVKPQDDVGSHITPHKHYRDGDYDSAFKYCTKAAELGDVISNLYRSGKGVEKDEKKKLYHLEEAAIAGHPLARHNLGLYEGRNKRIGRSMKHFIIAANLGFDQSIQMLK